MCILRNYILLNCSIMSDRLVTFNNIYKNGIWNSNRSDIPLSGPGSSIENTIKFRNTLDAFCKLHNIESIVDIGCGDLTWMPQMDIFKTIKYTGIDIVESLISAHSIKYPQHTFIHMDAVMSQPPNADLVIIRDVLFHLKHEEILDLFKHINGKYKYYVLTSCSNIINTNILNKYNFHEVNLNIEPFNFNRPSQSIYEQKFNRNVYFYTQEELPSMLK